MNKPDRDGMAGCDPTPVPGMMSTCRTYDEGADSSLIGGGSEDSRDRIEGMMKLLRMRLQAAREQVDSDQLTGALTRQAFRHRVVAQLAESARPGAGVLLILTIDCFKQVNDRFGHTIGDRLLALIVMRIDLAIAAAFSDDIRYDRVTSIGRLGGDEFGVYLADAGEDDGIRAGCAVLSALREPFFLQQGIAITASIGVATVSAGGDQYDDLLYRADLAMRTAKSAGRDRYVVFRAGMGAPAAAGAALAPLLREALVADQFELVFQPQIRVGGGKDVPAAEALVRWRHPTRGIVMPADFIPVAEETGLICDIGRRVVTMALQAVARWQEEGLCCRIAVNVSSAELGDSDLVGHIQEWLLRTRVPAAMLEIEVTESVTLGVDTPARQRLDALRALGISIAIDDFGMGYSNLSRLTQLPIDRLKIDRSLSADVLDRADRRAIAACIVRLAKTLGHEVVVEGIESTNQAALFAGLGCDLLQGYAISRPLDEAAFVLWLQAHAAAPMSGVHAA